MNCTFTKYEFGMKLRDYNICDFAQAMFGLEDFNWQLGTHTKTVGTGPSRDHTGPDKGKLGLIHIDRYILNREVDTTQN